MRLAQSPKHQLADPAFAAHLLGATASGLLSNQVGAVGRSSAASSRLVRDGLLLGALFESLVTQSVRSYAQRSLARVHHLRTARGDQASFEAASVLERAPGGGRVEGPAASRDHAASLGDVGCFDEPPAAHPVGAELALFDECLGSAARNVQCLGGTPNYDR